MSALSANTATGWQATLNNLLQAGQAYLTLEQQRDLMKINLQRAAQNLPPIDASQYGMGVQVGVNQSTQKTLYIALAAVAGFIVLNRLLK